MLADKNRLFDYKCMRPRQNFKNKQVNDNTLISNTQAARLWSHSILKPKAKGRVRSKYNKQYTRIASANHTSENPIQSFFITRNKHTKSNSPLYASLLPRAATPVLSASPPPPASDVPLPERKKKKWDNNAHSKSRSSIQENGKYKHTNWRGGDGA